MKFVASNQTTFTHIKMLGIVYEKISKLCQGDTQPSNTCTYTYDFQGIVFYNDCGREFATIPIVLIASHPEMCFLETRVTPSIKFESKIMVHSYRDIENHGMEYSVPDQLCVPLPAMSQVVNIREYYPEGTDVEVTIKILGE